MKRRFWSKVQIQWECWLWTGCHNSGGYGQFMIGSRTDGSRRVEKAHRVAWTLVFGPIPEAMCICHHCDNPSCVRPSHLFLGTHRDNILDMHSKGRHEGGAHRGQKHHNVKLTLADVQELRRRYASGGVSQARLGKEFGICQAHVGRIVRGERWV
jgi:hypothetical protein